MVLCCSTTASNTCSSKTSLAQPLPELPDSVEIRYVSLKTYPQETLKTQTINPEHLPTSGRSGCKDTAKSGISERI
jgi:hypothetical protein